MSPRRVRAIESSAIDSAVRRCCFDHVLPPSLDVVWNTSMPGQPETFAQSSGTEWYTSASRPAAVGLAPMPGRKWSTACVPVVTDWAGVHVTPSADVDMTMRLAEHGPPVGQPSQVTYMRPAASTSADARANVRIAGIAAVERGATRTGAENVTPPLVDLVAESSLRTLKRWSAKAV